MDEARTYLFGGEEVALTVRPHPIVLTRPALPLLASIALVAGFFNRFTVVVFFLVCARFSWDAGQWWVDRYVLTTNRILSTQGLITKTVASMPLAKITDLTYTRSVLGRLLGYGSMHLESAGQMQGLERVDFLPDPDEFYRTVMSLALGPPTAHTPDTPGVTGGHPDAPTKEQEEGEESVSGRHMRRAGDQPARRNDDMVDIRNPQHDTSEVPIIRTSDD